jgi:hypothetical protein
MVTKRDPIERVRACCLPLPEVTERLSHGAPTWFIRNKKTDAYACVAPAQLVALLNAR